MPVYFDKILPVKKWGDAMFGYSQKYNLSDGGILLPTGYTNELSPRPSIGNRGTQVNRRT